jgi:hypothetical protein
VHELPATPYAYLLGLYLGDGWIATMHRGSYCLRLFLDSRYPGIIREAAAAIARVNPGKRVQMSLRKSNDVILGSYWKHWPTVLPQHGPGPKHARPIVLAPWQRAITERRPEAFLRGLIHSDGSRYRAVVRVKGREYVYDRYCFSNRSEDIKALFCEHLDLLGVHWTRPHDREIAIATRAGVAKLDAFVGPKR